MPDRGRSGWPLYLCVAGFLLASSGSRFAGTVGGNSPSPKAVQAGVQASAGDALRDAEDALAANRLYDALKKCQQALDLNPKSADAYYVLGIIQRRVGTPDEARKSWSRALEIDPAYINAHIALGKLDLDTNDPAAADKEFSAALKSGDSHGEAHYGLGLALMGESKYAAALPLLLAAVRADPSDGERLFTLTADQLQLKQTVQARQNLRRMEELSAHDPGTLFQLGRLLLKQEMPGDAEADFERTAKLVEGGAAAPPETSLPELYLQIGQLRFKRSDYLGAIEYLSKVQPGSVDRELEAARLDLLGAALLATGKTQEARAQQAQAVELKPDDAAFAVHLIWTELLGGDLPSAAATMESARGKWPGNQDVMEIAAIVTRESLTERKRVPFAQAWHLKGEGMVCCPCKTPCPCRSNAPPTYGHCESTGAFRINQGHYGSVSLDDLTFVVASGSMDTRSVPAVFYVHSSATDEQMVALEHIFQEFIPLHQFRRLDMRRVPMSFERIQAGRVFAVEVPGTVQMRIVRQLNPSGEPLLRTAALDYFSNTLEYARNLIYRVTDAQAGVKWDYSGRQANYRTIDVDSRDYQDATMLIQFEDGSGYFTAKQLDLIHSLKLPMLASYPGKR